MKKKRRTRSRDDAQRRRTLIASFPDSMPRAEIAARVSEHFPGTTAQDISKQRHIILKEKAAGLRGAPKAQPPPPPGELSATVYVLTQDPSIGADELSRRAEARGIKLGAGMVHGTRSAARSGRLPKRHAELGAKYVERERAAGIKVGTGPGRGKESRNGGVAIVPYKSARQLSLGLPGVSGNDPAVGFRAIVHELGFDRALELLSAMAREQSGALGTLADGLGEQLNRFIQAT